MLRVRRILLQKPRVIVDKVIGEDELPGSCLVGSGGELMELEEHHCIIVSRRAHECLLVAGRARNG